MTLPFFGSRRRPGGVLLAACLSFSVGTLSASAQTPAPAPVPIDAALAEGFFSELNLGYPGLEAVKKDVEAKDWNGAARDYLEFRRTKSTAKWRINPADKPAKAVRETDAEGDLIVKHILTDKTYHMVKQPIPMGERIDWTFNPVPKTDPSYTKEFQWTVLNRHHTWEALSEAYWKTLDDKYTREWAAQLEAWIADAPLDPAWDLGTVEESYSWRLIETGIRMMGTWPNTYYRFLSSPAFSPKANLLYASSCLTQANHLARFLKAFPERSGNHVDMECTGLLSVGVLFPELKGSDDFVRTASDRMTLEIAKQVYPDGAQFELTPGYHTVSMDCFWNFSEILTLNNRPAPPSFDEKLKSMHRYLALLSDPRGEIPLFNDSWHFNGRELFRRAAKRWNDPQFEFLATQGASGTAPSLFSVVPYAGFYTMRGAWTPDALYACFRGGPPGEGHWQEDKLSFVLNAFGQPLVIAVGRAVYDESEWRRYVIGTTSHNTITVDGKEQHRGGFSHKIDLTQQADNPWMSCAQFDYVASTYDSGYQTSEYIRKRYLPIRYVGPVDKSVTHTRHFFFMKPDYFVAVDFLEGTGSHLYDAYFHLDAPNAVVREGTSNVVTQGGAKANLALYPLDAEGLRVRIAKGQEKPLLGWIPGGNDPQRKIPTVVYTKEQAAPATFATVLYPYQGEAAPAVTFQPLTVATGWARRIESPSGSAEIALPRGTNANGLEFDSSLAKNRVKTDARAVVIRRQGDAPAVWIGLDAVTSLALGSRAFTCQPAGDLLLKTAPGTAEVTVQNTGSEPCRLAAPGGKSVTLQPGEIVPAP